MTHLELERTAGAADSPVVQVRGEIDMASAGQLKEFLDGLVDSGARRLVLVCQELRFLDSSGIGALVAVRNRLGDGGQIVLESPTPHIRKVLEISGVAPHLSIVP